MYIGGELNLHSCTLYKAVKALMAMLTVVRKEVGIEKEIHTQKDLDTFNTHYMFQ